MTLLAPGSLLIAALLTVPPLVVFYLLKLRRRPMRVTSTMLWAQAARDLEVNVPLRWIRPSWLLILHTLILAMLLIAIGRPAIEDGGAGASRVFLLIDRSASMSARLTSGASPLSGTDTPLDEAKARARELVNTFAKSRVPPEVTVIAFATTPEVLGPPSRDPATIRSMIDTVQPTDQPGDGAAALQLVRSLTATTGRPTDSENVPDAPPLAIILSDGGGLNTRLISGSSLPIRVEFVGRSESAPSNIGIVSFAAERDIESPSSVRVFLRLVNTGANEVSVPVLIEFEGEPIARRAVSIPRRSSNNDPDSVVRISPGESAESFELEIPEGGVLAVSLQRADALAADNMVSAILPPVRRPAVLLVVPDPLRSDESLLARDRADPLLLDVLDAIGTAGLRVVDRRRYMANAEQIAEQFGLVMFDRVLPPELPEIPTITFGAPLPDSMNREIIPASEAGRTPVLAWNRNHPVMRDSVLDTIIIADRYRFPEDDEVLPIDSSDATARSPVRTTLARGDTGPLILSINDDGIRRLAVSFSLDDSNWPIHFSFPIFVISAFDYLVPGADSGEWNRTADAISIDTAHSGGSVFLEDPAGRRYLLQGKTGSRPLQVGRVDHAGLYQLDVDGSRSPIAVNLLDPGESGTVAMSTSDTAEDSDQLLNAAGSASSGQTEIWRWFVLAAASILLLEWLIFAVKNRI